MASKGFNRLRKEINLHEQVFVLKKIQAALKIREYNLLTFGKVRTRTGIKKVKERSVVFSSVLHNTVLLSEGNSQEFHTNYQAQVILLKEEVALLKRHNDMCVEYGTLKRKIAERDVKALQIILDRTEKQNLRQIYHEKTLSRDDL